MGRSRLTGGRASLSAFTRERVICSGPVDFTVDVQVQVVCLYKEMCDALDQGNCRGQKLTVHALRGLPTASLDR